MIKIKDCYVIEDGKKDLILNFGDESKIVIQENVYLQFGKTYEEMQKQLGIAEFLIAVGIAIANGKP